MTTTDTDAPRAARGTGHTGTAAAPFVPVQTRSARPTSFDPADFGAPTGREVELEAHPDRPPRGAARRRSRRARRDRPSTSTAPDVVERDRSRVGDGAPRRGLPPEDLAARDRVAARAETLCCCASPRTSSSTSRSSSNCPAPADRAHAHVVIEALPNARGTVVFSHTGHGAATRRTSRSSSRDGAHLTVVTVQEWDDDAVHARSHQARVGTDALLHAHRSSPSAAASCGSTRRCELAGSGARGRAASVCRSPTPASTSRARSTCTTRAPHTSGDVLYKGALQGDGARSVWVGDVLIGPDADGHRLATRRTATWCSPTARAPTRSRTSRSRPATSSAPDTRAPPAASTTSSCSTCRPAASPRTRPDASSCSASSPRSCRRSASPSSRTRLPGHRGRAARERRPA